jgi:predicted MPP superfamily phosphohydrolase
MFHTIITLAYVIPNIYVFIRIWHLFINKGFKVNYTIIYLLLISVYPLSSIIGGGRGSIASALNTIADYLLPFYLYIFLIVLAYDLFLIINNLFKIVPTDKFVTTRFKATALFSILLLSVCVVVAGIINFNTIRTSEYQVEIPAKSSKIRNLKIAFAADFHLQESVSSRFVERFIKKIELIKPDIMIFGGDIVEGNRRNEKMAEFENLLNSISTKYGVYTVLGNHEFYSGQEKGSFFDNAGIKVLRDTILCLDGALSLGGRYDSHFTNRKSIDDLLKNRTDSIPLILVDHRPTEILQVSQTQTVIQLSGHTHNGQMFPINLITNSVYELSWGYRKIGNTHFFVTSGIRLWGPPVRTVGKSEIMVINVTFTE